MARNPEQGLCLAEIDELLSTYGKRTLLEIMQMIRDTEARIAEVEQGFNHWKARANAAEEVCQVVEMDMNCFVGPAVVEALIAWRAQADTGGES